MRLSANRTPQQWSSAMMQPPAIACPFTAATTGFFAGRFAEAGATVALVARDRAALESLAAELGGTAHPTDLLDPEQLGRLVHRVEDDAGAVDVLVNNAGLAHEGPLWEHSAEELEAQVRLNLVAPLELCRQAVPRMLRRGGGHLVNVASLAAVASVPGMTAYAATKAGLAHGGAALRDELRGLPIAVTTVMVGGVPTELLAQGERYGPFRKSFQRLRRIQLLPDTDADDLAVAGEEPEVSGRRGGDLGGELAAGVQQPHVGAADPLLGTVRAHHAGDHGLLGEVDPGRQRRGLVRCAAAIGGDRRGSLRRLPGWLGQGLRHVSRSGARRIRSEELAGMLRDLAVMTSAGIPVLEALQGSLEAPLADVAPGAGDVGPDVDAHTRGT